MKTHCYYARMNAFVIRLKISASALTILLFETLFLSKFRELLLKLRNLYGLIISSLPRHRVDA